ncbi:p21-activated protein kinase-interacting protein 1-like isoform X2 [Dreissena polymorpha]|uniref:p21-activated protein kinase-interacting protein 1-like isoform X1 n=1 Tax=Dreissena polymorpha TaxID=45954 RepID=UPI00226510B4|nr:p21-activated protein kinase-interacting protein 1-like isoform X1 [Dreissena polymorpha]XP_052256628.1 p21-activated protein kinase-interacting protein 1-like isoform X2 [Dreissena polymorpha]XP_052256629.1 p21-activated protein kinase-interacting protein 1-like isoform X1 [Dreissena polymorpha]XP_052256632.1 p21-activated protein kinase-interacting protein 1-like isoform X2 [Dreissena polymorpha]
MEIVVGTYDDVVLGYRVVNVAEDVQIEASFTDNCHSGCVKCIAASEKGILATGSTDETIRLLNLRKMRELGSLVHHNGSVTSLQFHRGFLFSTSDDGTLCLWRAFTWECMRTFKGHKSEVNCVSVHPSGKLALTVGKDKTLHTWNLITGRSAYISNIRKSAELVCWSPNGDYYVIVINNEIDVYSVETAEVCSTIKASSRVNCLEFIKDDVLCYGGEGGDLCFHDISTNMPLHTCETKTTRIKGLCVWKHTENEKNETQIAVASSDGMIKLYRADVHEKKITTNLLTEKSTGFRITCMAMFSSTPHSQEQSSNFYDSISDTNKEKTSKKKKRKAKKANTSGVVEDNVTEVTDIVKSDKHENTGMSEESPKKAKRKAGKSEGKESSQKKVKLESKPENSSPKVVSKESLVKVTDKKKKKKANKKAKIAS